MKKNILLIVALIFIVAMFSTACNDTGGSTAGGRPEYMYGNDNNIYGQTPGNPNSTGPEHPYSGDAGDGSGNNGTPPPNQPVGENPKVSHEVQIRNLVKSLVVGSYSNLQKTVVIDFDHAKDDFCNTGSYETSLNNGSGTMSVTGDYELNKTSDASLEGIGNATSTYDDYEYRDALLGLTIEVDGSATFDFDADFSLTNGDVQDLFCSGKSAQNASFLSHSSEQLSGEYSVSGEMGAYLTFNLSINYTLSDASTNGPDSYNCNGSATVKSAGKTTNCTLYKSFFDQNFDIECQ